VTIELSSKPRRRWSDAALLSAFVLLLYLSLAYVAAPFAWKRLVSRHPELDDAPRITYTAAGIPGDPLNVALIGTESELKKLLLKAHWYPADALTLKSCLEIAETTVLKRPYDAAPVSNLFLWKRKEDLAFEKPVGDNPRHRHHVRFWRAEGSDLEGRPLWIGAATFDRSVGISHRTGQVTHHIASDIDAERDSLFQDLEATGDLSSIDVVPDFQTVLEGKNGGGDPWHTDGSLYVGAIAEE